MKNKSYQEMSKQELLEEIRLIISLTGLTEQDKELLLEAILEFRKNEN